MVTDLILGTAGHIDHGKTSLVKALTGTDTDRLPEEKQRGITIELGFAELQVGQYRLGIVDVPGHERFVRQMLAGATSIDLAMLVVAADDSVKPQTREHLEVLRLLDLPAGLIVLTKCDLPDPDWVDLVEEEVRELAAGTFLSAAPIIRTSAVTGEGHEAVLRALEKAADIATQRRGEVRSEGPFRMAIDRAFTVAGHGTVVTGSVSVGQLRVGDQLVIEPGGLPVRVRGLQNHDRTVTEVHRGQRAAVNLGGVHHHEVCRGHELVSTGYLVPSRLLTVQLQLLETAPRLLRNRARVRLHMGTAEVMASVLLLEGDRLQRGESAMAQLFLSEVAVASWNQAFVIRSESPMVTIGGGRVLVACAEKIRRAGPRQLQALNDLLSGEPVVRAGAAAYFAGFRPWSASDLERTAGIHGAEQDQVCRLLIERGDLVELQVSAHRTVRWHRLVLDQLQQRIESVLKRMHDHEPLATFVESSRVAHQLAFWVDTATLDVVMAEMQRSGTIRLTPKGVGLAGHGPKLSQSEQKLLAELVERYRRAGFQPPTVRECQQQANKNQQSVASLLALAAAEGDLVAVSADFFLHVDAEARLRTVLRAAFEERGGLTLSEIRELLNTTRKYAVPTCEYLDRIGFTRREGDLRWLAAEPHAREAPPTETERAHG